MSAGERLAAAMTRAHRLIHDGQPDTAARMLYAVLDDFDPASAPAEPALITAATLMGQCGASMPEVRRSWAGYAQRARAAVNGRTHPDTIAATQLLADLYQQHDLLWQAVHARRDVVDAHATRGDVRSTLRAMNPYAIALLAAGQCAGAHLTSSTALRSTVYIGRAEEDWDDVALLALRTQLTILFTCGHRTKAEDLAHRHQQVLTTAPRFERLRYALHAITNTRRNRDRHRLICANPGPDSHARSEGDDRPSQFLGQGSS